jgi:predicted DNA-binding transcriptional regulator YafY
MPTNLHALIRYRTIDECLRNRQKRWSWKALAEACGKALYEEVGREEAPSRRTIMEDIHNMRSGKLGYEAPIDYDRRKGGYLYSDPDFSIGGLDITDFDLEILHRSVVLLRQFQGLKQVEGLEAVITKLEHATRKKTKEEELTIQFEHSLNEPGQRWLDEVHQYILKKQCLLLTYQAFYEEKPAIKTVSPYLLKEYNNRWFLICWDHEGQGVYTYPLDRVQAIEPALLKDYYRSPAFHPKHFFRDIIGVTITEGEELQEIRILADKLRTDYMRTKPAHESQQELEQYPDGSTLFSFQLIPNYELEALLLSFGESIEVLSPESLREKIIDRLNAASEKYV